MFCQKQNINTCHQEKKCNIQHVLKSNNKKCNKLKKITLYVKSNLVLYTNIFNYNNLNFVHFNWKYLNEQIKINIKPIIL